MGREKRGFVLAGYLVLAGLLFSGLTGCAGKESAGETVRQLNDKPVDCAGAAEIVITPEAGVQDVLLQEIYSGKRGASDGNTYHTVDGCRCNGESVFYTVSYGEDMAQYTYLNQIYRVDLTTGAEELLYETEEAFWLNEFEATGAYLYWVEYLSTEAEGSFGVLYRVMQYELATGEVKCIAERDGEEVFEICLAAWEQYVTWYDDYCADDRVEIAIYDAKKQEFSTLAPAGTKKFSAYKRLDIVDGGITYFDVDEEENISINRYLLDSGETDVLLLGNQKNCGEPIDCFSSDTCIGWQSKDYASPKESYYFYDVEEGKLYRFSGGKGVSIFSKWLSEKLYFNCNNSNGHMLYVFDFSTGGVSQQRFEGSGMQFREYGDGQVYLEVRGDGQVQLMTVSMPSD